MFYIDGVSLSKIKKELKNSLLGKKINKITKNTATSISLHFGRTELVFSCNPDFPICYITDSKEGVLENSSGLAEGLKKHLLNAGLTDIAQLGYDRILRFNFSKINELGEIKNYHIYFELMGKYSNFIFTDENDRIIDLLKRFSLEENRLRALFPGLTYEQPIILEKISPTELSQEDFERYLNEKTLLQKVEGIGKLLVENAKDYNRFCEILKSDIAPKIFLYQDKIVLGTVLDIKPFKYDKVIDFKTYHEAINFYISSENLSSSFDTLKKRLLDNTSKKIKKDEKILSILEKEKIEKSDYKRYQELGDILASTLYSIKRGMKEVEVYDFYEDKMIKIDLDYLKSPQENLESYYKKYNKLKRGLEANSRRTDEINRELKYLYSIKYFVEKSDSLTNLKLIYEELLSQGYVREKTKRNKAKRQNKNIGYGIIEKDGYKILYGRNNIENDNLTFKVADKNDVWLHTKNIAGSHVIIKGENISNEILYFGAVVASFYSKANTGDKVSVDYTLKRYINKPQGGKPGFVTYVNEKNIVVIKPKNID